MSKYHNDDPFDNDSLDELVPAQSSVATIIIMGLAIVLMLGLFTWIIININPLLDDFIAGDEATPTLVAPDPAAGVRSRGLVY